MILIGALDSSLLSLPEINDYLVVLRCIGNRLSAALFNYAARRPGAFASTLQARAHFARRTGLCAIWDFGFGRACSIAAALAFQNFCSHRRNARIPSLEISHHGNDCAIFALLHRGSVGGFLWTARAQFYREEWNRYHQHNLRRWFVGSADLSVERQRPRGDYRRKRGKRTIKDRSGRRQRSTYRHRRLAGGLPRMGHKCPIYTVSNGINTDAGPRVFRLPL